MFYIYIKPFLQNLNAIFEHKMNVSVYISAVNVTTSSSSSINKSFKQKYTEFRYQMVIQYNTVE